MELSYTVTKVFLLVPYQSEQIKARMKECGSFSLFYYLLETLFVSITYYLW